MDLRVLYTHLAATYSGPEIACLQGLFLRPLELKPVLYRRHPKADLVRVIMAVFFVTFDKWRCTEIFQTGSGTGQGLSSTLGTGTRMLKARENQSNPRFPIFGISIDVKREKFELENGGKLRTEEACERFHVKSSTKR